jgi:hypothetical protein
MTWSLFTGSTNRPNNAVLAVAGDVKADEVIAAVKKAFGSWQKGDIPPAPLPEPVKLKGYKVRFVHKPGQTQTHIEIGHFGLAVTDPDYIPTVLANYVWRRRVLVAPLANHSIQGGQDLLNLRVTSPATASQGTSESRRSPRNDQPSRRSSLS